MGAAELWGYIVGALGLLIGITGWLRNTKGDSAAQAAWQAAINAKLDYITQELAKLNDVRERVALVEASVRSMHKRMDEHLKYDHQIELGQKA